MPSRYGIRARITGGSLLIAMAFSVVAGFIIYGQVQRIVDAGAIDVLRADAAPFEEAVAVGAAPAQPGPGQLIAVIAPDGTRAIDTLPAELSARLPEIIEGPDKTHAFSVGDSTYDIRDAEQSTDAGVWHVISARDTAPQQGVLAAMTVLLVASIAVINIAFGVATWLLTTAALRPVGRMRASAEVLAAEGGSDLLPEGPPDDEIAELARTLNALIVQLREATDRERQIVSDASHELRTPLAMVRTQLEIARTEARSVEQLTADIVAAEASLDRLSKLADGLLELSRVDAHSTGGTSTVDELGAELAAAADRGRLRASARNVRIDYDDRTDAASAERLVALPAHEVARILDNLVANSLAAIGDDGRIDLGLELDASGVRLTVADTGGGMDPDFEDHAFERFSRQSAARTGGGAGLGLAIVAGLVDAAGGRIALENDQGAGLTVAVSVPFAP
ncbi:MAG: HAMP domain-containing sensor histidine kinase [Leifsonia sp.]